MILINYLLQEYLCRQFHCQLFNNNQGLKAYLKVRYSPLHELTDREYEVLLRAHVLYG